jgi:hypothetical protein
VVSMAVIGVYGLRADGVREVLGVEVGKSEDLALCWEFLQHLVGRGLLGAQFVISDAHRGLKGALALSPGAAGNGAECISSRSVLLGRSIFHLPNDNVVADHCPNAHHPNRPDCHEPNIIFEIQRPLPVAARFGDQISGVLHVHGHPSWSAFNKHSGQTLGARPDSWMSPSLSVRLARRHWEARESSSAESGQETSATPYSPEGLTGISLIATKEPSASLPWTTVLLPRPDQGQRGGGSVRPFTVI